MNDTDPRREPLSPAGKRYVVRDHFSVVIHLALLLGGAQVVGWYNAWLVAAVMLTVKLASALITMRINPAVLNARGTRREMSPRDKLFFAVFIPSSLAIPLVAGLDAGVAGWSHLSSAQLGLGLGMMLIGSAITIWALAMNAFFEPTVRIQADRQHRVCDAGPYRVVRHPGYVGAIFIILGVPLVVGSLWALIPAAIQSVSLIVRTAAEDRLLRAELEGYADYAAQTRYRMLPMVW